MLLNVGCEISFTIPVSSPMVLMLRLHPSISARSFGSEWFNVVPEMPISEAVGILVQHRYSGAPVVDAKGRLVGVLSEKDCLRVAVLGTADGATEPLVRDYMTTEVETVEPDTDLLDVAEGFMQAAFRRFPVVEEGGRLVGQISRIDVLRAIDQLLRDAPPPK